MLPETLRCGEGGVVRSANGVPFRRAECGFATTRDAVRSPGRGSKYRLSCSCSGGPVFVPMMEPSKLGDGDNRAELRRLNRPWLRVSFPKPRWVRLPWLSSPMSRPPRESLNARWLREGEGHVGPTRNWHVIGQRLPITMVSARVRSKFRRARLRRIPANGTWAVWWCV
jgi:hypothetical protein